MTARTLEASAASGAAPDLSIVVVNWNGAEYLRACLASAVAPGREVIVVDNGSSDASEAAVSSFGADVVWIANGANLGFSTAANVGLRAARGRHVLFLNPDARANEAAIEAALAVLSSRPEVGLVGVAVRDPAGEVVPTVEPFFSLRALRRARWTERVQAPQGREPVEIEWCHGVFLLGRRDELRALGGFDERYFLYAEDMDLCERVHESGRSVVYLPWVSVEHEGNRAGRVLLQERRAAAIFASSLLFYDRRHGWLARATLRLAAGASFGLRALLYWLQGSPLAERYAALARVALGAPPELFPARPAPREIRP